MNATLRRIKELMDKRDWSLYQLAKVSGIPYSSLSALFQRNHQPTLATLERICNGFKISLGEFFSDSPPYKELEERLEYEEMELILDYRKLSRKDKQNISSIIKVFIENSKKADS